MCAIVYACVLRNAQNRSKTLQAHFVLTSTRTEEYYANMATNQGGSEIVAAVLSFPENEAERRARVAYAIVFVLAKSCALALTFIPPSGELAQVLFGLSIANFLIGFLMDACARRETKRWAGNRGPESRFTVCLLETIPGLDVAKTLGSAVTTRISREPRHLIPRFWYANVHNLCRYTGFGGWYTSRR